MARFDQQWCNELVASGQTTGVPWRVLYVVTETDEGKVAFSITNGDELIATAGKLARGDKADITVTATEAVLANIWAGDRSRDEAFMAGDIKVEGAYALWLDVLVEAFESSPWASAWKQAVS